MSDWYYSLLGEEFGPVTADTIHELLQDGTLDASDPVRSSDSENSITVAQFLQLHSQPEAEDATEAEEGSDLFWFQLEGITLGPVAGQSLIRLAEIGRISRDTLIRRDNEFLWEPASEFHELSIVFMLGQSDSSPSTGTATTKASSPQPIPEEAAAPV
ncbi:MAG: GYF domain-containing protein, partial [Planctomyces sp.]